MSINDQGHRSLRQGEFPVQIASLTEVYVQLIFAVFVARSNVFFTSKMWFPEPLYDVSEGGVIESATSVVHSVFVLLALYFENRTSPRFNYQRRRFCFDSRKEPASILPTPAGLQVEKYTQTWSFYFPILSSCHAK